MRSPRKFKSSSITRAKILCAALVIVFYVLYATFKTSATEAPRYPRRVRQWIQKEKWENETGAAQYERGEAVRHAMWHTFHGYKEHAWGNDEILPVSGGVSNTRNGWGATIVDGATTLALMQLWDELQLSVDYIISDKLDFDKPVGLVDPFETTIRYLGGLVSLVEMIDAKLIPHKVINQEQRQKILDKAAQLGRNLLPAYDSPTGMPYPRVDFIRGIGVGDPPEVYEKYPEKKRYDNPSISLARIGSNILENCALSHLTDDWEFCSEATLAWQPLIHSRWLVDAPGLIDAPIDIVTGEPVGRQKHWDAGHDSYYEYLIKAALLRPQSPNSRLYSRTWLEAADALRHNLSSRAAPSKDHAVSHLYMGKLNGKWFLNEQSHLACFTAGNIMLGARHLKRNDLLDLGQALLEGCRHSYAATPTGLGPESWSWNVVAPYRSGAFEPESERSIRELDKYGFWTVKPSYRLRPEYVESLFYAFRITGEQRYREWAWEVFQAIEKHCKTQYGYSGLNDVMKSERHDDYDNRKDEAESFWVAETLKYLYLIFQDVSVASLDEFVFTTEGHLLSRPNAKFG